MNFLTVITSLVLSVSLLGCATTKQARSVEESGFLGNYANLRKGVGDEPLYLYDNPKANCKKYDSVMVDPLVLWGLQGKSSLNDLSSEDRDKLRDMAESAFRQIFVSAGYKIVFKPGPNVMRVRAAITDAEKSNVFLEDVTLIAPYVTAPAAAVSETKGQGLFTGALAIEVEGVDALTGERLTATVDKRVGLLDLRNFDGWDNAKDILKVWQERALKRIQLCRESGSFQVRYHDTGLDHELEDIRP
jgi:hypothetical protein